MLDLIIISKQKPAYIQVDPKSFDLQLEELKSLAASAETAFSGADIKVLTKNCTKVKISRMGLGFAAKISQAGMKLITKPTVIKQDKEYLTYIPYEIWSSRIKFMGDLGIVFISDAFNLAKYTAKHTELEDVKLRLKYIKTKDTDETGINKIQDR